MDWSLVRLVVFDLDGTLYNQAPVRQQILKLLIKDAVASRSIQTLRILRTFRRTREALADAGAHDVATAQYARPAALLGLLPEQVQDCVESWMEERPLPMLRAARRPGVEALFSALRQSKIMIAVLSDYPVTAKLAALELGADMTLCATDARVNRLKPDPAGLRLLLALADVAPREVILIGDRAERDGEAGFRMGVRTLILSPKADPVHQTFASFHDPLFAPLMAGMDDCSVRQPTF